MTEKLAIICKEWFEWAINKLQGPIDSKSFQFGDYLEALCIRLGPHWDERHQGWDKKPETTRPLCAAVEAYIKAFQQ